MYNNLEVDVHQHHETHNESYCEAVLSALDVIARWQSARNAPTESLLDIVLSAGELPPSIESARGTLMSMSAHEWLTGTKPMPNLSELLAARLDSLTERELAVIELRLFSSPAETLDAIGARFNVTRERIRQIETKLLGRITEWMSEGTDLNLHALAIRQRIGGLSSLERLLELVPEIAEPVGETAHEAWFVIDKFDPAFESDGTWVAEPSLQAVREEFLGEIEPLLSPFGVLDAAGVDVIAANWPSLSSLDLARWLSSLGFSPWDESWMAPHVKSIPDKVVAYLSIHGVPRTEDQICAEAVPDRSVNAMKNAMSADSRLRRIDRQVWALDEWNIPAYAGIRGEIEKILNGEPKALSSLVEELTESFDVSAASVVTYAHAWPFQVSGGIVSMAAEPPVARRPLSRTRNLYRNGDTWSFRITVNPEHLRGSGFPIPTNLAALIGIQAGTMRTLANETAPVAATWRTAQPSLGSIRPQLTELGAEPGDQFIIQGGRAGISFLKLDPLPPEPHRAARRLVGLPDGPVITLHDLVGVLSLPLGTTWEETLQVIAVRGETDLLELL